MGSQHSNLTEKRVVIVGGGFAGAHAVRLLRGKCQLTIIDPREFCHYCIGSLRASVEPGFEGKLMVPNREAWGDCLKQGLVTSIDPVKKVVILEGGEQVPYDVLVIATGSSVPFPGKFGLGITTIAKAKESYKEMQGKIKAAKRVTIIGGGAVGVELAGELATDFTDKEVTVINSGSDVVPGPYKDKFRKAARKQLETMGVKLVLGERVTNLTDLPTDGSGPCTVMTDKGTEIETDLVIVSIGVTANSDAYKETFAGKLDERKFLKVNKFLQVEGYEDVFAVGDCNNADEVKLAVKAEYQMKIASTNIDALANSRKMKPYREETIMSLSLGRNGGVTQVKGLILGAFLTAKLKSGDMFVGKFWKDTMGLDLKE